MASTHKLADIDRKYRLRLAFRNSSQWVYCLYNADDELVKTYAINIFASDEVEAFRKQMLLDHFDMASQPDAIINSVEEFDKLINTLLTCPIRVL